MPVKGQIKWVQEKLIHLGYLKEDESVPYRRDKKYVKALQKFQADRNMVTNADVTQSVFEKLNYN